MPLILLDRDGVLNEMVIDPEHGTIDSPLHPDQVKIYPWVPEALKKLTSLGYEFAIVSNQPSAAKGKTTLKNLEDVQAKVLRELGTKIGSSHLCLHRAEDACACRKPKTGLLEDAFRAHPGAERSRSWMVGDGVTDVQAGAKLGLKTAYFGPQKCDGRKIFEELNLAPTFWGKNLLEFAEYLEKEKKNGL